MLTREQRAEFEERGVVWLPAAVDRAIAESLRAQIRAFFAERGLVPESGWNEVTVTPSVTRSLMKMLAFEKVWGGRTIAAIDEILGEGAWLRPEHPGQLLAVTPPVTGREWPLPDKSWHLDYPAPAALRAIPGVQLFLCVDRVEPRGGATLGIAGSHRLVDSLRRRRPPAWPGRSADVRGSLQSEVPWLRALGSIRDGEDRIERFMSQPTLVDGAPLQVVEFTGESGDVILMHPWLLHAPPLVNCGSRPRLVLTERIRKATHSEP